MTITFEDIKSANETLSTTSIKGKEYVEVNQRIKAFRMVFPLGSIETNIVSMVNGVVTMKASIKDGVGNLIGTGYAQEKESSSFINKTSFIENCETSAVGRALGMCGFGIDTSICSAEELTNALENQNSQTKENQNNHAKKTTNSELNNQPAVNFTDEQIKRIMIDNATLKSTLESYHVQFREDDGDMGRTNNDVICRKAGVPTQNILELTPEQVLSLNKEYERIIMKKRSINNG